MCRSSTVRSRSPRTFLTNAGEEASVIVSTLVMRHGSVEPFSQGYDTSKGAYVDMIKAWIVDSLKVVRTALSDASGVALLLTTSEACIVEAEEMEKPAKGGMGTRYGKFLNA